MVLCNLSIVCSKTKLDSNAITSNTFNSQHLLPITLKEKEFIKNIIDINDIYGSTFKEKPLFSEKNTTYQGQLHYEIVRDYKLMGNEDRPTQIEFSIDNGASKISKELILEIIVKSFNTNDYHKSKIIIPPGEVTSSVKTLLLSPNKYYLLDFFITTMNQEKWNLKLMQIH
jgi:hypothetical protein